MDATNHLLKPVLPISYPTDPTLRLNSNHKRRYNRAHGPPRTLSRSGRLGSIPGMARHLVHLEILVQTTFSSRTIRKARI